MNFISPSHSESNAEANTRSDQHAPPEEILASFFSDPSQVELSGDNVGYDANKPTTESLSHVELEPQLVDELQGAWHGMVLPNEEDVQIGAPQCQRCEVLPRPLTEAGTLVLSVPHTFTLGKLLGFLSKSKYKHVRRGGLLEVHVDEGELPTALSPMLKLLNSTEQRDVRAVFHFDGELPQVSDYFKIESLPDFVAEVRSAWLIEILRDKKIYSVFQPIVKCHNQSGLIDEVFGYECLMRATHNGQVVSPDSMIEMARAADLLFQLDLAARRAALLGAGGHKIESKVFINFSPNSVYDPWHCLRSTVNTVEEVGLKREQVVFEITETERLPEMSLLSDIVRFYREEGFQVALDDVGSGYSSLQVLLELRPDYVKLDMGLIRDVDHDPAKATLTGKLIETVQELGLTTIAEGIETPGELGWVCDQGADLLQGYLFAKPAKEPPALMLRS